MSVAKYVPQPLEQNTLNVNSMIDLSSMCFYLSRLLTPISRFAKVKSLKYLCRLTIREIVVADLIAALPVPPRLQQYLKAGPYYDANEEQDIENCYLAH